MNGSSICFLPSGNSAGLSIISILEVPSTVTWYSTDGAVDIKSMPNSRLNLSTIISICNNPKKPQRKPNPKASEVSGV